MYCSCGCVNEDDACFCKSCGKILEDQQEEIEKTVANMFNHDFKDIFDAEFMKNIAIDRFNSLYNNKRYVPHILMSRNNKKEIPCCPLYLIPMKVMEKHKTRTLTGWYGGHIGAFNLKDNEVTNIYHVHTLYGLKKENPLLFTKYRKWKNIFELLDKKLNNFKINNDIFVIRNKYMRIYFDCVEEYENMQLDRELGFVEGYDENKDDENKDDENKDNDNKCIVCVENNKTMAFVPCGHLCICQDCADQNFNQKCPLCRVFYTHIIQIYR